MLVAAISLGAGLAACGGGSEPTLDEATLKGIDSADLDLAIGVDVEGGDQAGHVDVVLSGPFQAEGEESIPGLDLSGSAKGKLGDEKVDFEGGLTLVSPEQAYVEFDGTEYEVDSVTFGFVKSLLRRPGRQGEPKEVTACQEALGKLKVGEFVEGSSDEGSVEVGGTETTKVSGDLDAEAAIDALIEVSEHPDCSGQLKAASGSALSTERLEEARSEVGDAIKDAHVELYVGDDNIVRRLAIEATIEPPPGSGRESAKQVALDFDLTLDGVNEEQTITAPRGAKPIGDLFLELGINPIELIGPLEGQGGGLPGLLEDLADGAARAR